MKLTTATLFILALFSVSASAFTSQLLVSATVNQDGTASVTETITITHYNQTDVQFFDEVARRVEERGNAFEAWQTYNAYFGYHIQSGSPNNTRVISKRESTPCGVCTSEIVLKYDVTQPIMTSEKVNERTTRFTLDNSKLAFTTSQSKETVIPPDEALEIILPRESILITAEPEPSNGLDTAKKEKIVLWRGRVTGKLEMVYEIERPLALEVTQFFVQLYNDALAWAPLLVLGAFALFAAWRIVKIREK
ncbi:MAG TPA: hypothetical protein VGQ00_03130 [Candidatus Norongarragalinales archaeon]|jgi:hypothetical protein|nr:hypothetical protein [Candidatus Norongarragalinales archaeon]